MTRRIYGIHAKRLFDVIGASVGLVMLSPLMATIAAAVKCTSKGPILYQQTRVGANSTTFTLLKFRSMPVDTPIVASAHSAELVPTPVGRLIRRLNVDELPQLLNILRGDMSIVGPRPALESQADLLELRTPTGSARLRPGLTGLAQVNSYEGMTAKDKAHWDEAYSRSVSLVGDLRLIVSTFRYLSKPPPQY